MRKNKLFPKLLVALLLSSYFQFPAMGAVYASETVLSDVSVVEAANTTVENQVLESDATYEVYAGEEFQLLVKPEQLFTEAVVYSLDYFKLEELQENLPEWIELDISESDYFVTALPAHLDTGTYNFQVSISEDELLETYNFNLVVTEKPNALPTTPEISLVAEDGVLSYQIDKVATDEDGKIIRYDSVWLKDGKVLTKNSKSIIPKSSGIYQVKVWAVDNQDVLSETPAVDSYEVNFPVFDLSQLDNLYFRAGERFTLVYEDNSAEVVALSATLAGRELTVISPNHSTTWKVSGNELTQTGSYSLTLTAVSKAGFSTTYSTKITVDSGIVNSKSSKLSVTLNGEPIEHIEAGTRNLVVRFTAKDSYLNQIDVNDLDRVVVKLNDKVLEGTDYLSSNTLVAERHVTVPAEENLKSEVTVDVFDKDCSGTLIDGDVKSSNYCFSKTQNLVIYDEITEKVSNLQYPERTNTKTVTITGKKQPGYGVKLNSADSPFTVAPNDEDTFSVNVPLAEGVNDIRIYTVKVISPQLVFYSAPVSVEIERDTTVSAPVWGEPAITLDGDNQATLHWTDPVYLSNSDTDFSHVNIYRSTVPNFVPDENNFVVQTHNPSWTDTGLTTGAQYYYVVEAVDDLGNTAMVDSTVGTGDILGESAAVEAEPAASTDYSSFGGKGEYFEEDVVNEGTEIEGEQVQDNNGEVNEQDNNDSVVESDDSIVDKLSNLWQSLKTGTSSAVKKVMGNIFVQICLGGILIFLMLMVIISVLVWAKERIVDDSMFTSESNSKKPANHKITKSKGKNTGKSKSKKK